MLQLDAGAAIRDCAGFTRREFINAGTLGLGGLTLSSLLAARADARASAHPWVRDRAVVLLFCSGGASHIETFDPNMDAPDPYRSATGEVKTTIPGVTFGGTFPRLAKLAHRMAIVRSFQHPHGGAHEPAIVHVLTGGTDTKGKGEEGFSIGSACARIRGVNHPTTGLPTYSLLNSTEVDYQYLKEKPRVIKGSHAGALGAIYAPFSPDGNGGDGVRDMQLDVSTGRLDDRRSLLASLDRMKRRLERTGELEACNRYRRQAFDFLLGSASKAFDISEEDPRTVAAYDTSAIQIGRQKFRASDLGKLMLMARRLVETGCGFVTVHSAGWDMHGDVNNPGIVDGMKMLGPCLDIAVSAFLRDLEARGLSEKVLLVITGDFGRTPKINKEGGRDHWSKLGTLAFAGGGLNMGQVIGRSAKHVDVPASEPISPRHMMQTILHTVFDVGELRVARGMPAELMHLIEGERPITELF